MSTLMGFTLARKSVDIDFGGAGGDPTTVPPPDRPSKLGGDDTTKIKIPSKGITNLEAAGIIDSNPEEKHAGMVMMLFMLGSAISRSHNDATDVFN